jgi:peptidoglycan/LPS O-acetylase OafA/YrhL
MKYRSEIDGLRAIAVLPVILFHAGIEFFSGGFVGVDVFFVISGFLITSIIINERDEGTFSFSHFYERRARRILPALFFIILCSIPFAWYLLIPSDMDDFAANVGTAAIFISNFYLLSQTGYFAADADLQPFVHTWSLSIEEQFYVFFPILLILSLKKSWRFATGIMAIVFVGSLLTAEWGWRFEPEENYYHSLTRFWELLVGSFTAFYLARKKIEVELWQKNILSSVGLFAILYSIFTFDKTTPFPSVYALIPTLGTSLVILFANEGTWIRKLLSFKYFVGIGLISYSLYLWHQPVFAFWRHYTINEPTINQMVLLSLLCFPLAYLTYRFIERPFRGKSNLFTRRQIAFFSGITILGIFTFGLTGHKTEGFISRLPENLKVFAYAAHDKPDRECRYGTRDELPTHPVAACLNDENPQVMMLGDSHAHAFHHTLLEALLEKEIGLYSLSYSGCIPLVGFLRVDEKDEHPCHSFVESAINYAKKSGIKTIVLAARFPLYLEGNRFDNLEGGIEGGRPVFIDEIGSKNSKLEDETRKKRVLGLFRKRIMELSQNFNVVLVQPVPEAGWDVPKTGMKLARKSKGNVTLSTLRSAYDKRTHSVRKVFDDLSLTNENIYVSNIQDIMCDSSRCYNILDNEIFYYDDDHLNTKGARLIVPSVVETIKKSLIR